MTAYSVDQIKEMAASVREWQGWDLARAKSRRAPVPWDYAEVVRAALGGRDMVLDMGCGDGKVLAGLADKFSRGVGIDTSRQRVHDARLSLPINLRMRVHFTRASAHAVPAPEHAFNVVLNRHAPLFAEEIDRVLTPGGVFITQQVGKNNTRAIYRAFEEARGPLPQWPHELSLAHTADVLSAKGYSTIDRREYDVPYVFGDAESLLYWLQTVPVPPDFDIERDAETVLEILDRLGTPHGIVTNEHRELLVMQKGG
jgi:SAM-dependent methyltransferase